MTIQPQFCVDCGIQLNFHKKAERCRRCRIKKNQMDKGVGWTQQETEALIAYMGIDAQIDSLYRQINTGQETKRLLRKKFCNHSNQAILNKKAAIKGDKIFVC